MNDDNLWNYWIWITDRWHIVAVYLTRAAREGARSQGGLVSATRLGVPILHKPSASRSDSC